MKEFNITVVPTNNPKIIKLEANHFLVKGNYEFKNIDEAKNSPLAQQLFYLPFIKTVYIASNFVALERFDIVEWDDVKDEVAQQLVEYLNAGEPVVNEEAVTKKEPITVYAEVTPNPAVMKFVSNKRIVPSTYEFKNIDEAKDSPLAKELFHLPFVKEVFMDENYVSVTKYEVADWEEINMQLREFIRDYLADGKEVVTAEAIQKGKETIEQKKSGTDYDDTSLQIIDILEEYVKPAVAGDGGNILSTSSATNSSYQVSAGTSMAAPGVTGSLLLLQQYHEELFGSYMKAATLKGLALHTADDVDAKGPDYKMGWGVINAKSAAEVLQHKDYTALVNEESLSNGETYSITVNAIDGAPLVASISWTDPESENINRGGLNSTNPALVNDLDIRITKNGETYFPWKLNPAKANDVATKGDNKVDPFERVEVDNAKGAYTITISHKGSLKNGFQDFSLIVSGAQISNCSIDVPSDVALENSTNEGTTITWGEAKETLFEIQYKSIDTDNWSNELIWDNNFELTALEAGKVYEARVRSICTENAVSEFSETIEFEFNGEETVLIENTPMFVPQELNISIFPNPAVDYLNVEAELSKDAEFSIVTTSGNVIKKGKTEGSINVSSLSSGLYVLVVQDYSGIKSTKFYKN